MITNKAISVLLAGQLIVMTLYSQAGHSRRKENFDVNRFDLKTISIPLPENKLSLININNITVIDARADTGRIGFMQKKIVQTLATIEEQRQEVQKINRRPFFLQLNSGLQKEAQQLINSYLELSGNDTMPGILMVIKKLWLSDELNLNEKQLDSKKILTTGVGEAWTSGADVKIDFYLRIRQDYYALYRYDSVINKALTISEYGPEFIALAIRLSLNRMPGMNSKIAGITSRRRFSLGEINQHINDAYNLPALKDSVLKAGVYMTFEEFKNNNPSQTDFRLKKERLADYLYVKQPDGGETIARNIWGYCNGKSAYIKAGDNFFLLQQLENAFYIFGSKDLTWQDSKSFVAPLPGSPSLFGRIQYQKEGYVMQPRPLQLDWDTGKLY